MAHEEHALFWGWADSDVGSPEFWGWSWPEGVSSGFPLELVPAVDFSVWAGVPLVESDPTHTEVHQRGDNTAYALQQKLGVKVSYPKVAGQVLICTADGVTEWMDLADAITLYGT